MRVWPSPTLILRRSVERAVVSRRLSEPYELLQPTRSGPGWPLPRSRTAGPRSGFLHLSRIPSGLLHPFGVPVELSPFRVHSGFDTRLGSGPAFAFPVQSGCYTRLEFRSNFRPSGVLTNLSICKPAVRLRFRPGRSGCPGDKHECTRRSRSGQMRSLPSFRAIEVIFADPVETDFAPGSETQELIGLGRVTWDLGMIGR